MWLGVLELQGYKIIQKWQGCEPSLSLESHKSLELWILCLVSLKPTDVFQYFTYDQ